jgi:hypothetical protein
LLEAVCCLDGDHISEILASLEAVVSCIAVIVVVNTIENI